MANLKKIRNFAKMKISQNRYLQIFCLVVILLALVRTIFPSVAESNAEKQSTTLEEQTAQVLPTQEEQPLPTQGEQTVQPKPAAPAEPEATPAVQTEEKKEEETAQKTSVAIRKPSRFFNADGSEARRRIVSVPSYSDAFPDLQDVQILSANKWGVAPVMNRAEAESRKSELVYVGSNPYFFVEPLRQSIPYLVPRASVLLQDIGRSFFDSLQVKGLPLHKIIITSVMRSKEDVTRLRRGNVNATENSCHMYGTTFDIAYNRYLRVEETDSAYRKDRTASDVRLKQILSEVLNDMRRQGRCWVKYEVKQGCFHATVR